MPSKTIVQNICSFPGNLLCTTTWSIIQIDWSIQTTRYHSGSRNYTNWKCPAPISLWLVFHHKSQPSNDEESVSRKGIRRAGVSLTFSDQKSGRKELFHLVSNRWFHIPYPHLLIGSFHPVSFTITPNKNVSGWDFFQENGKTVRNLAGDYLIRIQCHLSMRISIPEDKEFRHGISTQILQVRSPIEIQLYMRSVRWEDELRCLLVDFTNFKRSYSEPRSEKSALLLCSI
jgi:hypothetical protein